MKKNVFMLAALIIATTHETYGKNLELSWSYWPNMGGESAASTSAPQSTQSAPAAAAAAAAAPVTSAPSPHSVHNQLSAPTEKNSAPVIIRPAISVQTPKEMHMVPQKIGAVPATPTPAAQPAAAAPVAQAAGGNTAALAGVGAAFAAMGTMGASSQRNQPSHLNPYMMQGRTATERFNCVGKPPQQCQQEWNQLVQRIESMPGVRILNKSYSCGGMPGMMPTTGYPAQPYGMHPQQVYGMHPMVGGMHPMPMQQPHRSTLGSAAHGLTSLLRR